MTEETMAPSADAALLHSLCEEARSLATNLRGPVSRLTLRAGDHAVEIEWGMAAAVPNQGAVAAGAGATTSAADETGAEVPADRHVIVAPLLGTFYRSPEPGAKPFVEEGDVVEAGQDVAIVEAMKIMNRVQAERGGRVVAIVARDQEMVEFGQELMILEPLEPSA